MSQVLSNASVLSTARATGVRSNRRATKVMAVAEKSSSVRGACRLPFPLTLPSREIRCTHHYLV
jgi:hypothetical protein